jgi:hypothetical protein
MLGGTEAVERGSSVQRVPARSRPQLCGVLRGRTLAKAPHMCCGEDCRTAFSAASYSLLLMIAMRVPIITIRVPIIAILVPKIAIMVPIIPIRIPTIAFRLGGEHCEIVLSGW